MARQGLDILKDLTARRLDAEERPAEPDEMVNVVYPDTYLDQLLDSIFSVLVAAHESHQDLTAAGVLDAYRVLLPQTTAAVRRRVLDDIERSEDLLEQMPRTSMLDQARESLREAITGLA